MARAAPHIHAAMMQATTPAPKKQPIYIKRAHESDVKIQQSKAKKPNLQLLKLNFDDAPCFDEVDRPMIDAGIDGCGSGNRNILKQYKWHIMNAAGICMKRATLWSFIEDGCATADQAALDSFEAHEQTSVVIEKRDQLLPPPLELYKMMYTYFNSQETCTKYIAHQDCEGCLIDHPSQLEHMGLGGCLSRMPCIVDYYLPGICEQVQSSMAATMVRTLCEKYGLSIHPILEEPLTLPMVMSADLYT